MVCRCMFCRSAKRHGARRICYGDSAGQRCVDMTGHAMRRVQAAMDTVTAAESYTTTWQRIALASLTPRCVTIHGMRHYFEWPKDAKSNLSL